MSRGGWRSAASTSSASITSTTSTTSELKRRRLAQLDSFPSFEFRRVDLADRNALAEALKGEKIRRIVHLAAQANVRYALQNPHAYIESNVAGHLNMLEFCRHSGGVENVVYASSSSVYGTGNEAPFAETGVTDKPNSLYAATKKTQEMMSGVYAGLFGIPQIGLRFFSVYGPWGRPDMAYWLFTDAILRGGRSSVFNGGDMSRDFTYIDDIVSGVVAAADSPAAGGGEQAHRIYNIGNSRAGAAHGDDRHPGEAPRQEGRARSDAGAAGRSAGDLCRRFARSRRISASGRARRWKPGSGAS